MHIREAARSERIDIELLLAHTLNVSRSYLYTHPEKILSSAQWYYFNYLLQRRFLGEPIAYIVGKKSFWESDFFVNSTCLIPRPETELLVQLTLKTLPSTELCTILELATGCGAVAISLAKERPNWQLVATDSCHDVLAVAKANTAHNQLQNICFHCGNWFDRLAVQQEPNIMLVPGDGFNAIIANPPYIAAHDAHLYTGDVCFEPRCALVGGKDGLSALRKIIKEAPQYLRLGGWLALEHGYDQGKAVRALMHKNGFIDVTTHNDLSGHERVSCCTLTSAIRPTIA